LRLDSVSLHWMDGRMSKMDVALLGGDPAGLAAALALRQRGCSVALYDAQQPPIDKSCGEGLMPESVRLLQGLGIACGSEDGAELAGISFPDASCAAREGVRLLAAGPFPEHRLRSWYASHAASDHPEKEEYEDCQCGPRAAPVSVYSARNF
jgi:2-polyprenyl-6-methoxyphenol hydroxylase-like FAD-dependent oxidoreductase